MGKTPNPPTAARPPGGQAPGGQGGRV